MSDKKCCRCKETKAISEFGKDRSNKTGYSWRCKICQRLAMNEYRNRQTLEDKARVREQMRDYYRANKEQIGEYNKKYRSENLEKESARMKEWRRNNVQKARDYSKRQRLKDVEKARLHERAHNAVRYAIGKGALTRGPCEVCGATRKIEGHHSDYSKPLEVQWLCKKHHKQLHLELARSLL